MFNPTDPSTGGQLNVQSDHFKIAREIAAAGTVLLKNTGALPLHAPKSIAVIGTCTYFSRHVSSLLG